VPGARASGRRGLDPDLGRARRTSTRWGAFAALKARTVVENCAQVIATELVCACQGLEFHRPLRTTPPLEAAVAKVRAIVPRSRGRPRASAASSPTLADALRTGEVVL
jgi:histidine ammonia-lyase